MNEKKALFLEKALYLFLTTVLFFTCYNFTNSHSASLTYVPEFYFSWEKWIPYVEWMIVPYMSSDLLFGLAFLGCINRTQLLALRNRIVLAVLVSAAAFIIAPLTITFAKPEPTYWWSQLLWQILSFDQPFNQNPSLHISLAAIILPPILQHLKAWWSRSLLCVWFLLIAVSTVTVYQHHAIDILGGLIVAGYCYGIFPIRHTTSSACRRLFAVSMLCCLLALNWVDQWPGALLFYCSASLALLGMAYRKQWHGVFKKGAQGRLPLISYVLFLPYLIFARVNWLYYSWARRTTYLKLAEGIYLGRRPNQRDCGDSFFNRDLLVIDLAPELPEILELANKTRVHIPLLDHGDLTPIRLKQITHQISAAVAAHPDKDLYIHCALGMSRSAVVALAYIAKQHLWKSGFKQKWQQLEPHIMLPPHYKSSLEMVLAELQVPHKSDSALKPAL